MNLEKFIAAGARSPIAIRSRPSRPLNSWANRPLGLFRQNGGAGSGVVRTAFGRVEFFGESPVGFVRAKMAERVQV
jgi:hypothetical protein